jgi:TolA-binding protein
MAGAESSPDGEAAAVGGTPEPSEASTGKRRRTGGPSSRGVANLTPEQLARKRANDREAQRAIRERTKNQIDSLNRRIRELETQQPYHDLQVVVREKEAIQAENAEIRSRLQSVLTILQPILRPSGLSGMFAPSAKTGR